MVVSAVVEPMPYQPDTGVFQLSDGAGEVESKPKE